MAKMIHRVIVNADSPTHAAGLQTPDAELAERWTAQCANHVRTEGAIANPTTIEFEPLHGHRHGLDIVRSVHRLHADLIRLPDGSIQVRNLYHYPECGADDKPTADEHFSTQHPRLTKRQWAKIPQMVSSRHWVVRHPEKKQ